jgi:23S rRNA (guanosine2251-2'-O)-methyltransferase
MKPPHQNRPGRSGSGTPPASSGAPRRPGGGGFRTGGPRPNGGPQQDRPRSDKPRFDKPRGENPSSDRPRADKPYAPKPYSERPRTEGADAGRPRGDRAYVARPSGGKPHGAKPYAKPHGGKPASGGRPHGESPPPQHADSPLPRAESVPDRTLRAPRPDLARPSHTAEGPRGTLWIYGLHAVTAALANPARRLRRLMLTEEAEAAISARLPQPWPVQPERAERGRMDQLLGRDAVHQGAALLADPLATPALATVLERPGPVLVLDQVTDPRNVGAILRSAASFGVACVITQDRNAPEETGALAKAASGALETVPLLRAVNIARTLVALKAAGRWVVGLDASGQPLSGPALSERRVALVLGSEGEGLRRLTKDTCDEISGIFMPGAGALLDSLNVSATAAVALYELARR